MFFCVDVQCMYIVYSMTLHMICQYICQFSWRQITLGYRNNVALMCLQRVVKATNYIILYYYIVTIIYTLFHFDIKFGFCYSGI